MDTRVRDRDLRLDFFRGLALICIFIDHIPGNRLGNYTVRNLGLSDASELFVFISAYTAGLVYMGRMGREGLVRAGLRVWRRAGQIYVAHFLLLVVFCAVVSWSTMRFDEPIYVQGMNIASFLQNPAVAVLEALRLRFQPIFMDILPLYVVLLLFFPLTLWLIRKNPWVALAMSFGLYVLARAWQISLSDYPSAQPWKFNPLAWQLLFVIGAVLGALASSGRLRVPRRFPLFVLAAAYAIWAYIVAPTAWEYDGSSSVLPGALNTLLFPIMDRTNLSLWRLAHLLVLVYITTWMLRAGHPLFRSRVARPLTLCGQHALPVFCVGVLLSIAGWVVFTEAGAALPYQILVNAGGVAIMVIVAFALSVASTAAPERSYAHDPLVAGPSQTIVQP